MTEIVDERLALAIHRYEVISAYIAESPSRGHRRAFLRKLAERIWTRPDGEMVRYSVETLRKWIHRYREGGLEALKDARRTTPGCLVLTHQIIERACQLKREVPERSVERIIRLLEELDFAPRGLVRKSTLHRVLKAHNLSARRPKTSDNKDLDRWQADHANDLWQADLLKGPWLPDPEQPGKMRRTNLYAFIDDASRLLLFGRFHFKEDLPLLELVMRRALQRWGVPSRVYYDNGMVFRSKHMKAMCGWLGIHKPIHTKKYRPEGHGKIEAFNRFCRNAFIAEVKASTIKTLDELNEAFVAWMEEEYNLRPHAELNQMSPLARFMQDAHRRKFADEEDLRQAFLWRDSRTTDKCGVFKLLGIRYQCSSRLAKRRLEIRYDPEFLDEVEVWRNDAFEERVGPLEIYSHRRGQKTVVDEDKSSTTATETKPTANWLAHLVGKRRKRLGVDDQPSSTGATPMDKSTSAFVAAVRAAVDPNVFDEAEAVRFHHRYGPFPDDSVVSVLEHLVAVGPADLHLSYYLDEILKHIRKGNLR